VTPNWEASWLTVCSSPDSSSRSRRRLGSEESPPGPARHYVSDTTRCCASWRKGQFRRTTTLAHGIRVASAKQLTRRRFAVRMSRLSVRRCGRRQPGSNRPVTSSSYGRATSVSLARDLLVPSTRVAVDDAHRADPPRGADGHRGRGGVVARRASRGALAASGRYQKIGAELTRFKDRRDRTWCSR